MLALGIMLSAAAHLLVGAGLARYSDELLPHHTLSDSDASSRSQTVPEPPEAEPLPEEQSVKLPKMRELQLGRADSPQSDTLTWLGFTEATEHAAPQGQVDQSAMTLRPPGPATTKGLPGLPVPPSPPAPQTPVNPVETAASEPHSSPGPPIEPEAPRGQVDLEKIATAAEHVREDLAQAVESIEAAFKRIPAPSAEGERDEPLSPEEPRPEGTAEQTSRPPETRPPALAVPPATAPRPAAPPTGQGGGLPGTIADREAIAVAIKKAPVVKPGQVLAAQGLEVLTRAPRFSTVTMMTNRPKNPAVRVTFGKDGKVLKAEFVSDGKTTFDAGSEEVNRPLINSIYAWTAKGKALEELPDDPEAGVTILFTILLGA